MNECSSTSLSLPWPHAAETREPSLPKGGSHVSTAMSQGRESEGPSTQPYIPEYQGSWSRSGARGAGSVGSPGASGMNLEGGRSSTRLASTPANPRSTSSTCSTSSSSSSSSESGSGMSSVSCGNGKLRQWLIEQIDSSKYPGLVWENDEKSIFRIPWKHAGKQDYNREEDAALFKAWALFKGKFREGIDKPDPPTWKTRLRCALNKSNDFEELVERSQLDISDPYKVYRIVPEGAKKGTKQLNMEDPQMIMNNAYTLNSSYSALQPQMQGYMMTHERNWRDYVPEQPHPEIPYQCATVPFAARNHHWQGPPCQNGCQVTGTFYACAPPESQAPGIPIEPSIRSGEALPFSDYRLHICLYYHETLVKEVTTTSPEGCRISHGQSYEVSGLDQVLFPYPEDHSQRKTTEKMLSHLERGVILWMTPDGLYAKRLCQSRIYWDGPLALCSDRPNKLEREQTCKLFDTQQFLSELQAFAHHARPLPRFQIVLCFGEEFPDPQRQRKITAHVEPMFARQLYYIAQQNTGPVLRGYDISEQVPPPEDYHRSIHHSAVQE